MANTDRAAELVQAMTNNSAFQQAVQAAPNIEAKHAVLEQHGFGDVTVEDMQAYAESKGVAVTIPSDSGTLSDEELAAVAGGMDETTETYLITAAVSV